MSDDFHIRRVDWQQHGEVCAALRKQVFFDEVRLAYYATLDGIDHACRHVLALSKDDEPIGTGRIDADWNISRIAVLRNWREQSVGTAILNELIAIARDHDATAVSCSAPMFSVDYFRSQQFEPIGSVYRNADVPHQKMMLQLAAQQARNAGNA